MGTPDRAAALLFQRQHCPCCPQPPIAERFGAGAAPPSPLLTAARPATAGVSAGRTAGPARPLRQAGHGSTGEAGARPAGRVPAPPVTAGTPGRFPRPLPIPGHSRARRAASRARSLRSQSIGTRPPPPHACALPCATRPCPSELLARTQHGGAAPSFLTGRADHVWPRPVRRDWLRARARARHALPGQWEAGLLCRGPRACPEWPLRAASGGPRTGG